MERPGRVGPPRAAAPDGSEAVDSLHRRPNH